MIRNTISLLIIISLTVAFVIFWESPPEPFRRDAATTKANYPKAVITKSSSRQFSANGKLEHMFTSEETRHYQPGPKASKEKDYLEVTQPRLSLHEVDQPPWQLSADAGVIKQNGELIELEGNVIAWQQDDHGRKKELSSSFLRLKPAQQYAETSESVIMRAPGNTISAVGLKAYLDQNRIQLLSKVRGIHEAH